MVLGVELPADDLRGHLGRQPAGETEDLLDRRLLGEVDLTPCTLDDPGRLRLGIRLDALPHLLAVPTPLVDDRGGFTPRLGELGLVTLESLLSRLAIRLGLGERLADERLSSLQYFEDRTPGELSQQFSDNQSV